MQDVIRIPSADESRSMLFGEAVERGTGFSVMTCTSCARRARCGDRRKRKKENWKSQWKAIC